MSKRIIAAVLLLTGAMISIEGTKNGSSFEAAAQEKLSLAPKPQILLDCSFIAPLDNCIQDRFRQRGRGFGIERVMIPGRGMHTPVTGVYLSLQLPADVSLRLPTNESLRSYTIGKFVPENDQEREAVAEIEQSGLNMALYLASRNVLGTRPDEPKNLSHIMFHAPLRGPVGITRSAHKSDWPENLSLWKQAQKAMRDFDSNKSASQSEFSVEGKDFIARPVRAQESCLQCHTPETYQSDISKNGGVARQLRVDDPIGVLLYAYTTSAKSNIIKTP